MPSPRNRRLLINLPAVVLTIIAVITVVGCSGGNTKLASPDSVPPSANEASKPKAKTDNSCERDAIDAVKQHVVRSDVIQLTVIGGCSQLSIATSLDPSASAEGQAICKRSLK
jgi:hypothetical protein